MYLHEELGTFGGREQSSKPWFLMCLIMAGSAVMVASLYSCSKIMLPGCSLDCILLRIRLGLDLQKSKVRKLQPTVVCLVRLRASLSHGVVMPHGGRNKVVECPIVFLKTVSVLESSCSITGGAFSAKKTLWVKEWLPIAWPSRWIRSTISGELRILDPTQKKVAGTFSALRMSRMRSVLSGIGPSSNVSATCGWFPGIEQRAGKKYCLVIELIPTVSTIPYPTTNSNGTQPEMTCRKARRELKDTNDAAIRRMVVCRVMAAHYSRRYLTRIGTFFYRTQETTIL